MDALLEELRCAVSAAPTDRNVAALLAIHGSTAKASRPKCLIKMAECAVTLGSAGNTAAAEKLIEPVIRAIHSFGRRASNLEDVFQLTSVALGKAGGSKTPTGVIAAVASSIDSQLQRTQHALGSAFDEDASPTPLGLAAAAVHGVLEPLDSFATLVNAVLDVPSLDNADASELIKLSHVMCMAAAVLGDLEDKGRLSVKAAAGVASAELNEQVSLQRALSLVCARRILSSAINAEQRGLPSAAGAGASDAWREAAKRAEDVTRPVLLSAAEGRSSDLLVLAAAVELASVAVISQSRHHQSRLGSALQSILSSQLQIASTERPLPDTGSSAGPRGTSEISSVELQQARCSLIDSLLRALVGMCAEQGVNAPTAEAQASSAGAVSTFMGTVFDTVRNAILRALGLLSSNPESTGAVSGSMLFRFGRGARSGWSSVLKGRVSSVRQARRTGSGVSSEGTLVMSLPVLFEALCDLVRSELRSPRGGRNAEAQFEASFTRSTLYALIKVASTSRGSAADDASHVLRHAVGSGEPIATLLGGGGNAAAERASRDADRLSAITANIASCSELVRLLHLLASSVNSALVTRTVTDALVEMFLQVRSELPAYA
jgi:hypothetical protein